MNKQITRAVIPLYGIRGNIILSSFFSHFSAHNQSVKFFSTSTASLFEIDHNYEEIDPSSLTAEQRFRKYKVAYNRKYITSKKFKYITNFKFNPYYCTYDLETFKNENGIAIPYLFGIYIPEIGFNKFFGLNCVEQAINFILNQKYPLNKVSFYAHNAGNFDAYLIIKNVINRKGIQNVEYLMDQNNSMFYIQFKNNDVVFEFKDSYKLIPLGLNKLMKDFNININNSIGKLPFNHLWVTKDRLNYNGEVPFWLQDHIELLRETNLLINNRFDFEIYSTKYNEIDTIGLHKVIEKFFRVLVDNFHIDFTHCLTLPQLVMDLFRKRNLDDNYKIRLFSKRTQNLISKAYYGANTSVYKPYGENLYYYDINSLYPACMLKAMPVGSPQKYDIKKGLENLFGYALVKVECPSDLRIPVLPVYLEIEGFERLVFPTGTFKGYYFSEELKYAKSLGYKIELIEAWEFKKDENLFKDFVEPLYELKRTGNKSERNVFKLCLNTLYGRMGQKRDYQSNIITKDLSTMELIEKTFSNIKQTTLSENVACYSFNKAPNPELFIDNLKLFNELSEAFEKSLESRISNIAIAAAITAYARIEIDKYKRLPEIDCLYSDTDSVIVNKPLPKEFLGDGLGQMKNELADDHYSIDNDHKYFLKKGIFLRDKVYSLLPLNGKSITKFSGLNKAFITKELHNAIESVYLNSGKNLVLKTVQTSKDANTFEIKHQEMNKTFTFNYNKRIMIKDQNGLWIDTKPIYISSVRAQNFDFEPLIGRQSRQENLNKKVGLNTFEININHYNVFDTDYKKFDGFLLCYNAPLYGKGLSKSLRPIDNLLITTDDPFEYAKNKLLSCLQVMAEKAMEEDVLVKGIGYLISEEYITPKGISKINTIGYLNSFRSLNELLNIYEQHLNGIMEGGSDSGGMISVDEDLDENSYNIKTLYLRVLIPKSLIREKKVPADFLQIEAPVSIIKFNPDASHLATAPVGVVIDSAPTEFKALAEKPLGTDQLNLIENKTDPRLAPMTMAQPLGLFERDQMSSAQDNSDQVEKLIQELAELNEKIKSEKKALENTSGGFARQLTEALLMEYSHRESEILKELRRLRVTDINKLLSAQDHTVIKDPAAAPMTILIKPIEIKLLPAPPKYLGLPEPLALATEQGPEGPGAGPEPPSIIKLPAPLPSVIQLPGPLRHKGSNLKDPRAEELILKIKELNKTIEGLNTEIGLLNVQIQRILQDKSPQIDKVNEITEKIEEKNIPNPIMVGDPDNKNVAEVILPPTPAKLSALPAPPVLPALPAPSTPKAPQSKESEKELKKYYKSMGFKYIPRRRRLTQQELWFLDRGLWPEDMKSDDDDD